MNTKVGRCEPERGGVRHGAGECARVCAGEQALRPFLPLEDEPHHEDAEGHGEGEVKVLRLWESGFIRVLQVCPGDIVRKPKPLVPEPG